MERSNAEIANAALAYDFARSDVEIADLMAWMVGQLHEQSFYSNGHGVLRAEAADGGGWRIVLSRGNADSHEVFRVEVSSLGIITAAEPGYEGLNAAIQELEARA